MSNEKSWQTVKDQDEKAKRCEESVEKLELGKEYQTIRYVEAPRAGAKHWIEFVNADGQKKGFYTACFSFNSETSSYENPDTCPACKAGIKSSMFYAAHAIVRAIQEDKPESVKKERADENGFRIKDKGWTPLRVVTVPVTVSKKIKNIITLNKHKIDDKVVAKSVDHPKYGCDLEISYDKSVEGALMYDVQKGEKSALTEEEKNFLRFDLSIIPNFLNSQATDSLYYKEKIDLAKSLKQKGLDGSGADQDEDEEMPKSRRRRDDDEDDTAVATYSKKIAPVDDSDSDEDEEPAPKKKAKPPVDEDDEDEEPAPKKKAKPPVDEDW